MKSELKSLDIKIGQLIVLQREFKELGQAMALKEGILNDLIKDVCMSDLKLPSEGATLADIILKVREVSKSND